MFQLGLKRGRTIAIDLGNNNTKMTAGDIHMSQPSIIVLNENNKSVRAVGKEAYAMFGKVNHQWKAIRPMRSGVIADFESASKLLQVLMRILYPDRSFFFGFDYVISGVPFATTEVERRALRGALRQFNSGKTFLLYEPLAAAIGLGLDIREPEGKFVVDIGGGITEAALISLSGIVSHRSLKIGGDDFDKDIKHYFERQYFISIGSAMAEAIKINIGAAMAELSDPPEAFQVIGKNLITGIPKSVMVDYSEVAYMLDSSITKIEEVIIQALEESPPELAGDVYMSGIYLTGGSALLRGLKERLEAKTRLKVHFDPDAALIAVTKGISTVLTNPEQYRGVLFE